MSVEKHLFEDLIGLAALEGYKPVLYQKDPEVFNQIIGQDRFYLEMCLMKKWLLDERDWLVYVKKSPSHLFVPCVVMYGKPKVLKAVESEPEALYNAIINVLKEEL